MCDQRSQDLSVLLMQAVYLHTALFTSVGVSQLPVIAEAFILLGVLAGRVLHITCLKELLGEYELKKETGC